MRILFVHQSMQSYVAKDLAILGGAHEVRECEFVGVQNTSPSRLLADLGTLSRGVMWADLTFFWFGKLHAFFGTLFAKVARRKSIVVAGGDDVASHIVGERSYGLCASPAKGWFVRQAFQWADAVLAVSESNLMETVTNTGVHPHKVHLVYHGFDPQRFRKPPHVHKEPIAATVGNVDAENYHRKGLRLFVETARLLPQTQFSLIGGPFGPSGDQTLALLKQSAPPNVRFTGRVPAEEFLRLLGRSAVYVQASQHEAFGCSLAEAMLCECVPVVHRTLALPEVVGDCGYYIDELSPERLALAITQALDDPEMGGRARRRIIDHFPLTKRRDALLEIIERVAQA